jgi:uncharacterized protein (UPF0335 family)
MTTLAKAAAADLKSYLERIDRLEDERAEVKDEITAVYAEAKAAGFDPKAIRGMLKRKRAIDPQKFAEDETILDTYLHALGMIPENPLAVAVKSLAVDALARDHVIDAFKQMVPAGGEIIAKVGGDPLRIWRDETGAARVEIYEAPAASAKAGRGTKSSATVLELVPKDPVQAAADRAERRGKTKPPADAPVSPEDKEEPVE